MGIELTNHPAEVKGTELYRTVFVVEVLSNEPRDDWSLKEIAHDIVSGDSSGIYEVLDSREISKKDMAEALQRQGSDPEFLLGEEEDDSDGN